MEWSQVLPYIVAVAITGFLSAWIGGWLQARNDRKAARREASVQAADAAIVSIDEWWLPMRDFTPVLEPTPRAPIGSESFAFSGQAVARIRDAEVRRAARRGLTVVYLLSQPATEVALDRTPIDHQRALMGHLRNVLQAHARDERPAPTDLKKIDWYADQVGKDWLR